MFRAAVLAALLFLVLPVSAAIAGGVNLTWGARCWKDGGVPNLAFACNANNSGTVATLAVSFTVDQDHSDFINSQIYLEGMSEAASLPDWWRMASGECRAGSMAFVTDFTGVATSCTDLPENGGIGALADVFDEGNRIHVFAYWLPDYPIALSANVEYLLAFFTVNGAKTTGTGACTGCSSPVAWGVDHIELGYLNGQPTETLGDALQNQCVAWQGSTLPCRSVPARNMTWGQVKSLYR